MPHSEGDLVFPALRLISEAGEGGISTTELIAELRKSLPLDEEDKRQIKNRSDDRFSQTVRNLKSHDTLEIPGYAVHIDGKFYIDTSGSDLLVDQGGNIDLLYDQGFESGALSKTLKEHAGELVVEEGEQRNVSAKSRKRSRILRKAALAHFAESDGSVACVGCGINPIKIYGASAMAMIEIHHTEPVALMPKEGIKFTLEQALSKVVPLCANCHRLTHMNREKMLSLTELKALHQV